MTEPNEVADKLARVRSTRQRRPRSHKLIVALALVVALVIIGGGADVGYAMVKSRAAQLQAALTADLQAGQKELEAGKASLTQANAKHDATLVTQATAHFASAKDHFLAAGRRADNSTLLRDLELVPSFGDSVRSRHKAVDAIAKMGVAISDAGRDLSTLDAQIIKPPASGQAGRTLLTVLDQAKTGLVGVHADFEAAKKAAAQVDVNVLPAGEKTTFVGARNTIDTALAGLDEFDRLVPVLVEALGGNGLRTYLVEQVNPAELRAGGGFIGTYSLIRANHGSLSLIRSGNATELSDPRPLRGQPGFVPELGPLREVIPQESWSFLDSNLFPDFPSNAKAAEQWVQPRLGIHVDGVMSIDYYAVAKMLELTGPLAVPGYGSTVTAGNFIPTIIRPDIAGSPSHKAILAAVAGPLMARISALRSDRWPALLAVLNGLASAHHLQAYFGNSVVESEMGRVGWSGATNPTSEADYLMEIESNYTGNKTNYFITRHYTLVLSRQGNTLHHTLTVDLVNAESCCLEDRTYYHVDVRLYVPNRASAMSSNLKSLIYPNPTPPAGTKLLQGWLPIINCCGGRGQAVLQYDTPWPFQNIGVDQLYWQKQPGTTTDKVDVVWNDGKGHSYHASGNLAQDRSIMLTPNGVALVAVQTSFAQLPSLSLG